MSAFLTDLEVENINDTAHEGRGSWALLSPLKYQSDIANTTIVVPAGFVTDFASVPRLPVAYALAGDTAHKAAVVHDWLYSTGSFPRGIADKILKEAALTEGVPAWRAWLIYAGVRLGGGIFYGKDKNEKPTPAPADEPLA